MVADLWVEDAEGNVVGNHKMKGGLSVGVPGEVDGLCYALETYGTMSLEEVIQPAIDLAYQGYTVSPAPPGPERRRPAGPRRSWPRR